MEYRDIGGRDYIKNTTSVVFGLKALKFLFKNKESARALFGVRVWLTDYTWGVDATRYFDLIDATDPRFATYMGNHSPQSQWRLDSAWESPLGRAVAELRGETRAVFPRVYPYPHVPETPIADWLNDETVQRLAELTASIISADKKKERERAAEVSAALERSKAAYAALEKARFSRTA